MARKFHGADYLDRPWPASTTAPLSFALWVQFDPSQIGQPCGIAYIGNSATNDRFLLTKSSNDSIQVFTNTSPTFGTIPVVANRWYHLCAVWVSSSSWRLFINGVLDGEYSGSAVTPSGVNRLAIGSRFSAGSNGLFLRGSVASPALWTAALMSHEVRSLASGASPWHVRPASLLEHWRLSGWHRHEASGAVRQLALTVSGTTWTEEPSGGLPDHSNWHLLRAQASDMAEIQELPLVGRGAPENRWHDDPLPVFPTDPETTASKRWFPGLSRTRRLSGPF